MFKYAVFLNIFEILFHSSENNRTMISSDWPDRVILVLINVIVVQPVVAVVYRVADDLAVVHAQSAAQLVLYISFEKIKIHSI